MLRRLVASVGSEGPRFHLFGPTVEYANRMESTGLPGKVQISPPPEHEGGQGGDLAMGMGAA